MGCVRRFTLRDGNLVREQLLALSDPEHVSTYCILDATLPMRRYVATVQLKRVTDGDRTFWHWQSTFDVPRGREQEFEQRVGVGVYEGGFEGLRAYLRRGLDRRAAGSLAHASGASGDLVSHGIIVSRFGGPDVLQYRPLSAASARPRSASTTSTCTCAPGTTACSSRRRRSVWRRRAR